MNGNQLVAMLVGALLIGGGVVIGATVFNDPSPAPQPETAPPEPDQQPEAQPDPKPMLGTDEAAFAAAVRRIDSLEEQLRKLREERAQEQKKLEPLMKLYEQAKEHGMVMRDGLIVGGAGGPPVGGTIEILDAGADGAKGLAGKIGLEGARRQAFVEQYEKTMAEIRDLEKRHAKTKVDGDVTTIEIPKFGSDGDLLRRNWDDWLAHNLTDDERKAYDEKTKEHLDLFQNRMGNFDRTITIDRSDGSIGISEKASGGPGAQMETQMTAPEEMGDFVLQPYAHLLPNK